MFISFEGPDGSGKTSQITPLADYLRQAGYDVLTTREPGGTYIGNQVRTILASTDNITMRPNTEVLLFQASRAQLVEEVILPHLAKQGILISDRYADSTLAYQGYGHGIPLEPLSAVIHFATRGLKPDLTLFLDLDIEDGLNRRAKGGGWNRLDAYDLDFHRRAYQGYQQLIQAEPFRWVVIDARQSKEQVQETILKIILNRLSNRAPRM